MVDRIEAWLRMRDTARFRADAERAARGIRKIGESAQDADRKLKKLQLTSAGQASIFHVLERNISKFSGRLKIAGALLTIFGPDLISLAASATSAAMGFGLLGATAGGAATVGLGGFGLVLANTLSGMDKIKTAQDAYNLALQQHGRWSDEALNAQEKLNAVIGLNGGQAVLGLLNSWNRLKKSFASSTSGGRIDALGILTDSMKMANRIMPTFAKETNKNIGAIRWAMRGVFDSFASGEGLAGIRTLSQTFRGMFGPLVQGGANVLIGLFAYFRQAGPWVVSIADAFGRWAQSFRESSRDGDLVNSRVSMLVGHLIVWKNFAGSIWRLMKQIWSDANQNGGNLVEKLTGVVDSFTAWIAAGEGTDFFERWGQLTSQIGGALVILLNTFAQFVDAAFPGMQSGAGGLQVVMGMLLFKVELLSKVLQFLGPLVGPLVVGFYALRVATLLWAAATTILGIAMRLTPLGWIVTGIALVIAAIVLISHHMGGFGKMWATIWGGIKSVFGAVWGFIKKHWEIIPTILLGPFGYVGAMMVKHFDAIKETFRAMINWVISKWNNFSIGMGPKRVWGHTVFPGFRLDTPDIPLLATGGDIMPGGVAIVGDQGPELARNEGGKTRITPLAKAGGGSPMLNGVIHIRLDNVMVVAGREVARSTADTTADWNARKGR
jgi:hypothetical protein